MNQTIADLLNGKTENHMLPFFWQHGETEEVLIEYVDAIQRANCNAFCVESRPHPDFCGPGWWRDMDIILREARKRKMQVWILDDSHFPTGYANGAAESAPEELCRQSIFYNKVSCNGGEKKISLDVEKYIHPKKLKLTIQQKIMMNFAGKQKEFPVETDQIYSVTAIGENKETIDLTGKSEWKKPEGNWDIYYCFLSHNMGYHRNYINMMMYDSCRLLIDAVYEKHYERYQEYFGNTIAGFFSDEPELGNGIIYQKHNILGTEQDLPWSKELEEVLGDEFRCKAALLWNNDADTDEIAKVRYQYMDAVTRLVQKDFSEQIGNWCRQHGVMYIGHLIEDDDTHSCTGSGLGHFFRGLSGQDMAGIDDIGGQVLPQGEKEPTQAAFGMPRNGGFYHYTLGKLGVSAAYFDEKKKGRTMCEIFGNYGWGLDMKTMKYLADHFMVRGVNYFVPHAFSPKDYPDPDCPPHFYAHGNNPLYPAFGQLCGYMNRVSNLISDGKIICKTAILYTAESEWMGEVMSLNLVAEQLYNHQIDYLFLPMDSINRADEFEYLIVPEVKYLPESIDLEHCQILYVNKLPENVESGQVVAFERLADMIREGISERVDLIPKSDRIRVLHYKKDEDLFYLFNESDQIYEGIIKLPCGDNYYGYNAWDNCLEKLEYCGNKIQIRLRPNESMIIGCGLAGAKAEERSGRENLNRYEISEWTRSVCSGKAYPDFEECKKVQIPDDYTKKDPYFSGYLRYETVIDCGDVLDHAYLEISDAEDAVEVFVNGHSLGIQIVKPYVYDLTAVLHTGYNKIRIEVATTLLGEQSRGFKKALVRKLMRQQLDTKAGLTGTVTLYK